MSRLTYSRTTRCDRRYIAVLDFKKSGFFLVVKGSSKPKLHANFAFPLGLTSYNTTKSIELQRNKVVVEIPFDSIRKEDYRPIIEDAIVSKAIEPKRRYKLRNSPAKGTTFEVELVNSTAITNKEPTPFQALFDELEPGIPYIPNLERYRAIGARGEAIIPLEKRTEECKLLAVLGSKTYLVYILSRRAVLKTSTIKFIEDNTVLSQPTSNSALKGELVDLDLDLEGAVSPDPSHLNTEKPISIEIGPSKLEPYESSSDSELDKPLLDKPINPVIVESTRPTISTRKPELPEAFLLTIEPILVPKPIEVIAPNQPITNEPLNISYLISEVDKMQLNYYKLFVKLADLGPKLSSSSSNTNIKLIRDFYSKEGPRPLTTTSTTKIDSRNGKGSSRTSIINSSLVSIGFSDSDFAGDKAISKSTYGYLYKLAALHARTKYTLLKFRYIREQVKAKIVTIIYLNTKY
ncbi:hypothetical protein P8C59_003168 [Phyllachora maydis]|uniref:Uncharacterized protein n=1 Tax=Phyllachora maydis TaxID=1825666 RepID=A0AAD9M8X5_9PEZI|nr:hypothetical protein P8C59_003168 [Phyllachora maydis]